MNSVNSVTRDMIIYSLKNQRVENYTVLNFTLGWICIYATLNIEETQFAGLRTPGEITFKEAGPFIAMEASTAPLP